MERIILLTVAFLMGFVFIIFPLPEVLVFDALKAVGTFLKHTLGLVGFLMMIYSSVEIIIALNKARR
ncbi:hypothetical protein [Paenibacillus sp. LHD-38]|uniref:hypothetical protein n=1 Tax=Paenibacillus sp. LHD-38 TaxID=3072143 RepID=UPI00280E3904|nr:hypothetical protein [Paenibacillus sp. LHD-38]MDQ8738156.1 hypothetical protein [Paenibacillus sp. LHD-38]